MTLNKNFYFLSPVEVVKVTAANLQEAAEWCGGSVQETESRHAQGRMDQYILVPTPKGTKLSWAFPGMFITKRVVISIKDELKETYAVFRRDYFEKNYFETPKVATDKTWERLELEKIRNERRNTRHVSVTVNVGDELIAAQKEIAKLQAELAAKDADVAWPVFGHDHVLGDVCSAVGCEVDRYLDGDHHFTDCIAYARPDQETSFHNKRKNRNAGADINRMMGKKVKSQDEMKEEFGTHSHLISKDASNGEIAVAGAENTVQETVEVDSRDEKTSEVEKAIS